MNESKFACHPTRPIPGATIATPSAKEQAPSPISCALNELSSEIQRLHESIASLEHAFQPVLAPVAPVNPDDLPEGCAVPPQVPQLIELFGCVRDVRNAIAHIENIQNRSAL